MKKFFLGAACVLLTGSIFMTGGCVFQKSEVPIVKDSCIIPGDTASYARDIIPIITTNCDNPNFGSCHQPINDGGGSIDYTSYDGIKQTIDDGQLAARVIEQRNMPPSNTLGPQTLSSCDLKKISLWIAQGGPNN